MNWQAVSFDWNQVRAFLATAEEGSLSAAARVLETTQPTVGRQVTALEVELGVMLFERAGRSLVMTSAGHDLLEHVKAMGDAASRISMVAAGQSQEVAGEVSITASDLFSSAFLPAILVKLREVAPQIVVTVVSSNRIEDLTRRDADIAIRHLRPEQPDLIARQLTDFTARLYAASSYFDVYGRPQTQEDLSRHIFIGPRDLQSLLSNLSARGLHLEPAQFCAFSDSGVVMWEMVRAGLGIGIMPDGLALPGMAVEPVLPDMEPMHFPVWLTTHRELRTSRRIRIVYDALAEALRTPPRPRS